MIFINDIHTAIPNNISFTTMKGKVDREHAQNNFRWQEGEQTYKRKKS